jgi:hypothetical protein
MSGWDVLAVAAALACFSIVLVAALILLTVFVRKAADALSTLGELRERTDEAVERRETVAQAREAVEEMRAAREVYGESADADLMEAVMAERKLNGKPFRVEDNERQHADEEQEPSVPGDSFYVPSDWQ